MADKGDVPQELRRRRVQVEIKRLELQIEQQELEVMELEQTIVNRRENIAASKGEIEKQQANLNAFDRSVDG